MSGCTHPQSALFKEKGSHVTHCTLCGDVVFDQQFEIDPVFVNTTATSGPSRPNFRPTVGNIGMNAAHNRPSVETARRGLHLLGRELVISDDLVEIALGIYKMAQSVNAIAGARTPILCACLYIACRREKTSHVVYDFCEFTHDDPHVILSYVRKICEATHTAVPSLDPSLMVHRFAVLMDLGDKLVDVIVCALKVLRIMKEDWISSGRRPMGVCVAALLVACYMFNIPRGPEQVCGMARLTAPTIAKRLMEFSKLPAAKLERIDDYHHADNTLPPAFNKSSLLSTEEDMNVDMRNFAKVYYELVSEAKLSEPATLERCEKWRWFIQKHCEIENKLPDAAWLDLSKLSFSEQFLILGLKNSKPIPRDQVEESIKQEEDKVILKKEAVDSFSQPANLDLDDPAVSHRMTAEYKELLQNKEIKSLDEDFEFEFGQEEAEQGQHIGNSGPTQMDVLGTHQGGEEALSPPPQFSQSEAERQRIMFDLVYDRTRRYALPWEFIILQDKKDEDVSDIMQYIITDNEERLRRYKLGEKLHGSKWDRGRARTRKELDALEENRRYKQRKLGITKESTTVTNTLEQALRNRAAANIDISNIHELLPGLDDTHEEDNPEWD